MADRLRNQRGTLYFLKIQVFGILREPGWVLWHSGKSWTVGATQFYKSSPSPEQLMAKVHV